MNHDDWKTHYSPDIYQVPIRKNDFNSYYKTDLGQQYFNLIDNGTSGSLYHEDWNLLQPDSLLLILDRRIKNQLSYFDGLLKAGEINKTFYDIARLNIEYTNAYRLVATIYYSWPQGKFKTSDTTIYPRLKKIYSEVFRRYPVNKELKIETHYCFDRYVDLYLLYIADSETGEYIPGSRKGKASEIQLTYSENYLNNKANDFYRMLKTLTYMFDYGSNSLKVGKEYLSKPHLESKFADRYIEEFLIPRAKEYEDQYNRPLPSGIVILDEKDTLETFEQLLSLVGGGPVFIDLWGTWCLPCRYQFQYIDSLKPFFHDNGIKKIYIAVEYQTGREEWKNFLKLYNPEGYHMMANSRFKADFERHAGKISKFPTFMIIDKNGEIVERNAFFPSDAKLLVDQLKEKLKLVP
ncbi:MAG: TlpA disulfide reductase family protein [Bacteroidales bacterium]